MLIFTAVNDFIDFFLLSIFCFCISYLFFFFLLEPCNKKTFPLHLLNWICVPWFISRCIFTIVWRTTDTQKPQHEENDRADFPCTVCWRFRVIFTILFLKQSTVTRCEVNEARHWIGCWSYISQCGWLYQPQYIRLNQLPQIATSQFKVFGLVFSRHDRELTRYQERDDNSGNILLVYIHETFCVTSSFMAFIFYAHQEIFFYILFHFYTLGEAVFWPHTTAGH